MKGIKNNPLAYGLLGLAVGSGGVFCAERIIDNTNITKSVSNKSNSNFEMISYDENGDVYITEYGKRYHNINCYTLNNSHEIRRVNSEDAEEIGLKPCKKCL